MSYKVKKRTRNKVIHQGYCKQNASALDQNRLVYTSKMNLKLWGVQSRYQIDDMPFPGHLHGA